MSVNTNESIYNLIPEPVQPKNKTSRYRSKFNETVKVETKQSKANSKTMGPAKVLINEPRDFLKKKSNSQPTKQSISPLKKFTEQMKPCVPRHDERPQMAKMTNRDFVKTNAIENITTIPKKPIPKCVDSPQGTTYTLEGSGLVPEYIHKKEYGKAPGYLEKRKIEMEQAQAEYERYIQESFEKGQMKRIEGEERHAILEGLKQNWAELHREYQGLSVVTDTIAKKARKEKMEASMKQLEKDIEVIERHNVIYVEN